MKQKKQTRKQGLLGKVNSLATMLGIGGLNGSISLAALAGLFRPENAFMLGVVFLAGPGAILTVVLLDGPMKERMLAALIAGILATAIVIFAAGVGPKLLEFVNLDVIKIAGAISIFFIALIIAGIKIPTSLPTAAILLGLILGGILR